MRPALALVLATVAIATVACRPPGYGRDDVDATPGGDAAPPGDGGTIDAGPPDATPACQAAFRLEGHGGAVSVWLTGDFVAWAGMPADGAVELARGGDGAWTVVHGFATGSYQYKFIIDAAMWIPDPGNPNTVPDGFGGVNSVYNCP